MSTFETPVRLTPFLWFNNNAAEAVDFYLTIFKNSRRLSEMKMTADGGPVPKGSTIVIGFELDGQRFTAMNGGPGHPFTDAISFVVRCESQQEVDGYWAKLTADGGQEIACGWLKDKFGLSWQIVPARLGELLAHPKAMQAMMTMKKLIIADLEAAAKS
jgi:predicted 3-demethylubiquinone-9 3-methyltransferase (glyoxalase superfamily)